MIINVSDLVNGTYFRPVFRKCLPVLLPTNNGYHAGVFKYRILCLSDASSTSLTLAGIISSFLYKQLSGKGNDKFLWWGFVEAEVVMLIFGFLIRPYISTAVTSTLATYLIPYMLHSVVALSGFIMLTILSMERAEYRYLQNHNE